MTKTNQKTWVLLDNGHGVETPGKRSPDGKFREYSYARKVTRTIAERLKKQGVPTALVVTEDRDVSLAERVGRVKYYCDRYGKKNVVLVSVHCNAAGDGRSWLKARGWSAYTSTGRTEADLLASDLYCAAEKYFKGLTIRKDERDGDPDIEADFYILRNTPCPAVLTENFFQDNREDVRYLTSPEGFEAVVNVHVEGLLAYLKR